MVTSWLANSFADLTNSGSQPQSDTGNCFVVHVKLVNNLVNNSSNEIAQELADLFSNDFLYAFVKPSLLDVRTRIALKLNHKKNFSLFA